MKKIAIILFVIGLAGSCERPLPKVLPTADEIVSDDFNTRFPAARIVDISNWDDGKTDIHFMDADGLDGVAVYLDGTWMITEKTFHTEDVMYAVPWKVVQTYMMTGPEIRDSNSENSCIFEIARKGIAKKQYEFHGFAPFDNGTRKIDNLQYDIVIDEDGTLLTYSHHGFNRSVWCYDMRSSIDCVRNKYGDVPILGAVNDGGDNVLFIRDKGIVKTVTLWDNGNSFEWKETRYPLSIHTVLPTSVLADKERFEAAHPEQAFYALSSVEFPEGLFYGLTFGTELEYTTLFSKAE